MSAIKIVVLIFALIGAADYLLGNKDFEFFKP